jgi:hypothetical protein
MVQLEILSTKAICKIYNMDWKNKNALKFQAWGVKLKNLNINFESKI